LVWYLSPPSGLGLMIRLLLLHLVRFFLLLVVSERYEGMVWNWEIRSPFLASIISSHRAPSNLSGVPQVPTTSVPPYHDLIAVSL
jgi:hypothetical protein